VPVDYFGTFSGNCYISNGGASYGSLGYDLLVRAVFLDSTKYLASLGVELASFTAANAAGGILLQWRTESERGSHFWRIERATCDAGPYASIGTVAGMGNSAAPRDYSFTDAAPPQLPECCYRLAQVDQSGAVTYYGPVRVTLGHHNAFSMGAARPNPMRGQTSVSFTLEHPARTTLKVFNLLGQEVTTLIDAELPAGAHAAAWDGRDHNGTTVAGGIYYLKMSSGGRQSLRPVTIIR
jgi:hypothetical protein